MSDQLIASLNAQLERLQNENAQLRAESAKRRNTAKDLTAERDTIRKELEAAKAEAASFATERDTWKGKAEVAPGEQAKRVKELESQIVLRDHKDAFRGRVNGKLHDKASLEEVWAAIGYQPGDSLPTAEQIDELVGKAREAKPYLFTAEPQAGNGKGPGGQVPAPLSGAGGGRGNPDLQPAPKSLQERLMAQMRAEG
jgi:hypothetical protein